MRQNSLAEKTASDGIYMSPLFEALHSPPLKSLAGQPPSLHIEALPWDCDLDGHRAAGVRSAAGSSPGVEAAPKSQPELATIPDGFGDAGRAPTNFSISAYQLAYYFSARASQARPTLIESTICDDEIEMHRVCIQPFSHRTRCRNQFASSWGASSDVSESRLATR